MRILSIGNSFSEDAQRYLHRAARAQGLYVETANLMIGGCSLERHYKNMLGDIKDYVWQFNGYNTSLRTTLEDALLSGHWDVVTLQQVSHLSPSFDSFEPYMSELVKYVRRYAPDAKIIIHQTWAYEYGSKRLCEELKYERASDMLRDIVSSYDRAAAEICADGIIPSGELLYKLSQSGIEKVHRDTFHASLGVGRYALSLLWIRMLCGVSVTGNAFSDFDLPVTDEERRMLCETVESFEPIKGR